MVAIHTETVYGLAANALSEGAVRKIYELKGRPKQNPLIVHIFSSQDASKIAHTTSIFYKLSERFWPGPLSFVLPARENIPLLTRAGLPTVALRSPQSKVFRKSLERLYRNTACCKSDCKGHCYDDICIFLLGTLLGPLVFVPGGLYLLIKAAIEPDIEQKVQLAKM